MSASSLQVALQALGIECAVEARQSLAVATLSTAQSLGDDTLRRRAVTLARDHGFTHLAVEILDAEDRATLSRD